MTRIHTLLSDVSLTYLRDAQFLLADLLQVSVSTLLTHDDRLVSDQKCRAFQQGLQQLMKGKPLAYVVGNQPFWSLNFLVNEHTLIPRPDTEHLVEHALLRGDELSQTSLRLLDLGTGSGAVAICLKHERPTWDVTATDFSVGALQMAKQNAAQNNTEVQFLQGSWFQALSEHRTYHVIVSNPPYIAADDEHLAALTDEPITALVADNAGMADIETIVAGAQTHLEAQGWLLVEHGYNQGALVRACFLDHGFEAVSTIKDFGGNDRLTQGMKPL